MDHLDVKHLEFLRSLWQNGEKSLNSKCRLKPRLYQMLGYISITVSQYHCSITAASHIFSGLIQHEVLSMHDFWMLVHFGFLEWWRCAWLFCFWKVCPSSFFRCICSFLLVEPLIWLSAQKIIGTWQCSWRNAMAVGLDKPLLGKNGSKAWQWAFTCFDIVKGSFWQQPMTFESVWLWKLEGEVGSTVTATAECPEPQISEPMESGRLWLPVVENAWGHQSLEEHGWRRPIECPRLDVLFTRARARKDRRFDDRASLHSLKNGWLLFCYWIRCCKIQFALADFFHECDIECDQPLAKVCVAFQYASVVGGLLIMLFSAFVCTGGQSQAILLIAA